MTKEKKIEVLQTLLNSMNEHIKIRLDARDNPYDLNGEFVRITKQIAELTSENELKPI